MVGRSRARLTASSGEISRLLSERWHELSHLVTLSRLSCPAEQPGSQEPWAPEHATLRKSPGCAHWRNTGVLSAVAPRIPGPPILRGPRVLRIWDPGTVVGREIPLEFRNLHCVPIVSSRPAILKYAVSNSFLSQTADSWRAVPPHPESSPGTFACHLLPAATRQA